MSDLAKKKKLPILIAIGCLVPIVLGIVLLTCLGGLVFLGATGIPDGTDDAMAIANRDARVTNALGSPVTAASKKSGGVTSFGSEEYLDTVIVVEGPSGKGEYQIAGMRKRGRLWSYDTLVLTPVGGSPINLQSSR